MNNSFSPQKNLNQFLSNKFDFVKWLLIVNYVCIKIFPSEFKTGNSSQFEKKIYFIPQPLF